METERKLKLANIIAKKLYQQFDTNDSLRGAYRIEIQDEAVTQKDAEELRVFLIMRYPLFSGILCDITVAETPDTMEMSAVFYVQYKEQDNYDAVNALALLFASVKNGDCDMDARFRMNMVFYNTLMEIAVKEVQAIYNLQGIPVSALRMLYKSMITENTEMCHNKGIINIFIEKVATAKEFLDMTDCTKKGIIC